MKFSVIIPVYNKAPYVSKALDSVFAQTFSDYEVIIVDDGSTDNSAQVVQNAICGKSNVTFIQQKNSGVSTARNNAISASHGDFFCLLDADDWWAPTFLEKMDALIHNFPDAELYATNYFYYKNGRGIVKLDIPTGYYNYFKEYADSGCMIASSSSSCMKKTIFNEVGGFNPMLSLGEDFDLWVRIAAKYKTAFFNEPLVYFNQDIEPGQRATHKLHKPEKHMLWNLDYMLPIEDSNPDYKRLIDRLRVTGLMPYFLSKEYHFQAAEQLQKVDWTKQSAQSRNEYNKPLWFLRAKYKTLKFCSRIKQWLLKTARN